MWEVHHSAVPEPEQLAITLTGELLAGLHPSTTHRMEASLRKYHASVFQDPMMRVYTLTFPSNGDYLSFITDNPWIVTGERP